AAAQGGRKIQPGAAAERQLYPRPRGEDADRFTVLRSDGDERIRLSLAQILTEGPEESLAHDIDVRERVDDSNALVFHALRGVLSKLHVGREARLEPVALPREVQQHTEAVVGAA